MRKPLTLKIRQITRTTIPLLLGIWIAVYSGLLLLTTTQSTTLIERATIAIEELQAIVQLRTAMNRQIMETLNYLYLGEPINAAQIQKIQTKIIREWEEWLKAAERSSMLETPGEQEELGGIIVLRAKYQSVAAHLNTVLEEQNSLNEETPFLEVETVTLLEQIYMDMKQKIDREIEEAYEAYTSLNPKTTMMPFSHESFLAQVDKAKTTLSFLQATDEIAAESINITNALNRSLVSRDQELLPKFEAAKLRKRQLVAHWADILSEQVKQDVYTESESRYKTKRVAKIIAAMEDFNGRALAQMQKEEFKSAGRTIENRVEGTLDAHLLPSLNEVFRDGQERLILQNARLQGMIAEIQYLAIFLLVFSIIMLITGLRHVRSHSIGISTLDFRWYRTIRNSTTPIRARNLN